MLVQYPAIRDPYISKRSMVELPECEYHAY